MSQLMGNQTRDIPNHLNRNESEIDSAVKSTLEDVLNTIQMSDNSTRNHIISDICEESMTEEMANQSNPNFEDDLTYYEAEQSFLTSRPNDGEDSTLRQSESITDTMIGWQTPNDELNPCQRDDENENRNESEIDSAVKSALEDVLNTIQMSDNSTRNRVISDICEESMTEEMANQSNPNFEDDLTYYEAEQSFLTSRPNDGEDSTLRQSESITDTMIGWQTPNDELNRCQRDDENEKEYSPKYPRKETTDYKTSDQAYNDWKHSPNRNNEYDPYDYYKSIGSKYDGLLNPWSEKKEPKSNSNSKSYINTYPSRQSVLRNFDPLVEMRNKSYVESRRETKIENNLNESSDLADMLGGIRLSDTPKAPLRSKNSNASPKLFDTFSPIPQMDDYTTESYTPRSYTNNSYETQKSQQKVTELEEIVKELEEKLREKEHRIEDMKETLIEKNRRIEEMEENLKESGEEKNLRSRIEDMEENLRAKNRMIKEMEENLKESGEEKKLRSRIEDMEENLRAKNHMIKEMEERIKESAEEKKLRSKIEDMEQQLLTSKQENDKLFNLVNVLHNINEDLVLTSSSVCNSMADEKNKVIDEKLKLEKSLNEYQIICDKMKAEFKNLKESEDFYRNQSMNANNKLQEYEKHYRELSDKYVALERQKISQNDIKEMENELMSYRIQQKKSEMRIGSLGQQLEQKIIENKELSEMVDELIAKVRK
ncbi:unnamed protein product [Oppiella nova]|uniref:Uncharacterized protein n=1 Tax=Oppiella nova TaxID=334625 RepID=A0A7R9QUC2_9ACAR|nr:unnamed protein product [Oppiella nova]CAG2175852.1 unnamed protein product [Oppiella nova]